MVIKVKSGVLMYSENLLEFNQLETGKVYRMLHGGEKDHGYNYQLLPDGTLFNRSKNRRSGVPFSLKTRFIETENKFLKLASLDFEIEFHSKGAKIGCQNVSIEDLKEIAAHILVRY
jgi:hypothetical protein